MKRGQKYSDQTIKLAKQFALEGHSGKTIADMIAEHTSGADRPSARQVHRWIKDNKSLPANAEGNNVPSANQDSLDTREDTALDTPIPVLYPPLALLIAKPKIAQKRDRFSLGVRTLTADVEANAEERFVVVVQFVLVIGGMPISEEREPGEPRRQFLGKTTWHPVFRIPEGVSSGTYQVRIGAGYQPIRYIGYLVYLGPLHPKLIESDPFEVRIPELMTLTAAEEALVAAEKAAEKARQEFNVVHHALAPALFGDRWELNVAESEKATEALTDAKKALEEARQRVIQEDGTLDLGSYGH